MDILVANDVQKEPSQRDGYTDAVKPLFRKNGVKVLNH